MTASKSQSRRITVSASGVKRHGDGEAPTSVGAAGGNQTSPSGSSMTVNELRFDGRVAVVTGAGRGVGRQYVQLLAQRGAAVVVNDFGVAPDGSGPSAVPAEQLAAEIADAVTPGLRADQFQGLAAIRFNLHRDALLPGRRNDFPGPILLSKKERE